MASVDRINNRILEREYKKNFLEDLEAPAIEMQVTFASAEMKRLFGRYFDITQRNIFMIEEICRVRLPHEVVAMAEAHLEAEIQKAIDEVAKDTEIGEGLMKQSGIDTLAAYLAKPLDRPVKIVSHISAKYLEVFQRLDHLLRVVATLRISRCISTEQQNFRRSQAKRVVRRLASVARMLFVGLRKRWDQTNAGDAEKAAAVAAVSEPAPEVDNESTTKQKGKGKKSKEVAVSMSVERVSAEIASTTGVEVEAD